MAVVLLPLFAIDLQHFSQTFLNMKKDLKTLDLKKQNKKRAWYWALYGLLIKDLTFKNS